MEEKTIWILSKDIRNIKFPNKVFKANKIYIINFIPYRYQNIDRCTRHIVLGIICGI